MPNTKRNKYDEALDTLQCVIDELADMIKRHNRQDPETGVWDYDYGGVAEAQKVLGDFRSAFPPPEGETRPGRATDQPQDYPEDAPNENGNYWHECPACKRMFIGDKGRVVCKLCIAEPAHSSEKALRNRIGVALDMALHFKVTDTTNDTIGSYQKWREETLDAILASSPAPEATK